MALAYAPAIAAPTFDLQSHSTCSDGALAPALMVARAREAGVQLLSLTDHDTVAGVQQAIDAAHTLGDIRVLPGTEISALDEDGLDLHILGYAIDHEHPGLLGALERWRADRHARAERMAAALRAAGLELELPEEPPGGAPIGRPHLAAAVLAHPANGQRLAAEGLTTPGAVLEAYLLPGTPGYSARTTPTVAEAIEAIHAAGGLSVWAHPFWDIDAGPQVRETLERFAALGIDGVEAFYVTHTREQTLQLVAAARELRLRTTGSADFHGPAHERFSRFRAFELHGAAPDLGRLADWPTH